MMVMPSNNTGLTVGHMAGRFPERIGLLMSPGGWRKLPSWMPYALDNGAYGAWVKQTPWDAKAFQEHLAKAAAAAHPPLWVVVPDVVMDKKATLGLWRKWAPLLRNRHSGFRLAFAVQDGMSEEDVPSDTDVVFVGGSTEWKWRTLSHWTDHFEHVHVARVNSERLLWLAHRAGAESCDGTGWMRGDQRRLSGLLRYLETSSADEASGDTPHRFSKIMQTSCRPGMKLLR